MGCDSWGAFGDDSGVVYSDCDGKFESWGGSLEEERQIQEQIQLGNDATAQCNDVNDSYDIGAISLDIAKQYFENAIAENDDNMYKMYVIVCYADFVYDAGEGIDSAVAVMNRLEPWLDEDIMRLNYYTGVRDLYNEDGNMEQANYYNDLAYELGEEMDGKRSVGA